MKPVICLRILMKVWLGEQIIDNCKSSRVETREEPIECGREPIESGRRFGDSYVSKIRVQTKIDFRKVRKRKA